ncbi:MAG: ABC transporter permease subunit [Chloroflexota bacterium]
MKRFVLLNRHVLAVMENEWAQLIRNRVVVYTTVIPTFLLVALAVSVVVLSSVVDLSHEAINKTAGGLLQTVPGIEDVFLQGADRLRASLLSPFLVLFQIIPLVVPITIASYSIVGEKQQRSLEPLLATPIKTWELLLAKALSAALPGVLSTWWGFAVFLAVARIFTSDTVYNKLLLSPTWIFAIVLLAPLFTLLAVGLGIIISSRVKDPNSAQQLGSLLILPVIGLLVAQISGAVRLSTPFVLSIAFGVALLDAILLIVAVRLFRREEILTGWH